MEGWTVTTVGASAEAQDPRHHDDTGSAWDDYSARIFGLMGKGFDQVGEEFSVYGRRWSRDYVRAGEHVSVRIDRGRLAPEVALTARFAALTTR
jgi:hypothetical protein